jgi:uncharacterized protein
MAWCWTPASACSFAGSSDAEQARACVTNPRILTRPLGPAAAVENVSGLVRLPHVRTPGEADGFWDLYRATAGDRLRGSDVSDGHIATLMRQHGVGVIYTRDRGFRRFDGIQVRDPFAG